MPVILALLAVAACDRTYRLADGGTAADATDAIDAQLPRDAAATEPDAGPPDEPRSGQMTLLEIAPAPGDVHLVFTGRFFDRPLAAMSPGCVVELELGDCRRARCMPEASRGSAGEVLVEVDGTPVLGTMELMPGTHQGSSSGTGAPPGARIAIVAPGADVPAFRVDARMPAAFAPALPRRRLPGEPLRIDLPPAGTDLVIASIVAMSDPALSVTCTAPGDGGPITIEAPLLEGWPAPEPLQLAVGAVDRHVVRASPYAIEAYVGRFVAGPLELMP